MAICKECGSRPKQPNPRWIFTDAAIRKPDGTVTTWSLERMNRKREEEHGKHDGNHP